MIDFRNIDLKNIQIPISLLAGAGVGLLIGLTIGIVSGGAFLEIVIRSFLSAIIVGGVVFGVEQLLRRFASEVFEQPSKSNTINIREEDDISISEIYSDIPDTENTEGMDYHNDVSSEYQENENIVDSSMDFSESNVFSESDNIGINLYKDKTQEDRLNYEESKGEENASGISFRDDDEYYKPYYQDLSSAELGVTKQAKVGLTEDFIIPSKSKPIPRDPKKMAEAIRTKLKEEK